MGEMLEFWGRERLGPYLEEMKKADHDGMIGQEFELVTSLVLGLRSACCFQRAGRKRRHPSLRYQS